MSMSMLIAAHTFHTFHISNIDFISDLIHFGLVAYFTLSELYFNKDYEQFGKELILIVIFGLIINLPKQDEAILQNRLRYNLIKVDPFCLKQFKEGATGFIDFDPKKF